MDLKSLGEFGLIDIIKGNFTAPEGILGIGDDCAIIPKGDGNDFLVSTDMLVEGVHFLMEDADPYNIGWKSAAVNISDIAAMGGKPEGTFLAVALPKGTSVHAVEEFIRGYRDVSEEYSCPLLGGDTTSSPDRLCICVTAVGEISSGKARLRSYARPGDLVCTTGFLGDSGGGLRLILEKAPRDADAAELVSRHYLPRPRVREGIELSSTGGVHAMMDISDGIGSDIRHILRSSGTGALIDVGRLPLSPELRRCCDRNGWDPIRLAIEGGEDFELLFTVDPQSEKSLKTSHFVIGEITTDTNLVWNGSDKDYMGYRHF